MQQHRQYQLRISAALPAPLRRPRGLCLPLAHDAPPHGAGRSYRFGFWHNQRAARHAGRPNPGFVIGRAGTRVLPRLPSEVDLPSLRCCRDQKRSLATNRLRRLLHRAWHACWQGRAGIAAVPNNAAVGEAYRHAGRVRFLAPSTCSRIRQPDAGADKPCKRHESTNDARNGRRAAPESLGAAVAGLGLVNPGFALRTLLCPIWPTKVCEHVGSR